MSYAEIGPDVYRVYQPDSPWHPGAEGWYSANVPGWGQNPNLLDRRRYAIQGLGCGGSCGCGGGCKGVGATIESAEPESDAPKYLLVAGLLGVVIVATLATGKKR